MVYVLLVGHGLRLIQICTHSLQFTAFSLFTYIIEIAIRTSRLVLHRTKLSQSVVTIETELRSIVMRLNLFSAQVEYKKINQYINDNMIDGFLLLTNYVK